jgi:hypothetical protein
MVCERRGLAGLACFVENKVEGEPVVCRLGGLIANDAEYFREVIVVRCVPVEAIAPAHKLLFASLRKLSV